MGRLPQWVLEIVFVFLFFSNQFHPRDFEKAFWSYGIRRPQRRLFLCGGGERKSDKEHSKDKTQSKSSMFILW